MTRLFLIRHGQPTATWGGGDPDPGLSEAGRAQAVAAAAALSARGPLQIISSPLRRCRETAAPFVEISGAHLAIDERVGEVRTPPGVIDRRLWLQENFPWQGGAPRSWTSMDESLRMWREDVLSYIRSLTQDGAVFTHFIAMNVIVGAALDRSETIVFKPEHASITEMEFEAGRLRLVRTGAEMQGGEVL